MRSIKTWIVGCMAGLLLLSSQPSFVSAEEETVGEKIDESVDLPNEKQPEKATKGPRCTFTRAEKIGMLFWIIPIAGAVYTPLACKRNVFDKD